MDIRLAEVHIIVPVEVRGCNSFIEIGKTQRHGADGMSMAEEARF
jgi:hypothetical protein